MRELLLRAADEAAAFRDAIIDGPVIATAELADVREAFGGPLNDAPMPPADVLEALIAAAKGGLMSTPGPRFFGFVIGGALPAATAADMLATGWDQCAFNPVLAPAATAAEEAAGGWLKELLGIPATASVGFVTGAQAANTVGLASARHQVLADAGWDVETRGLIGAPRIRVIVGAERHATIDRSLRLLGLGTDAVEPVRVNAQGAIDVAHLAEVLAGAEPGPTIVCLQAGNVNTGAFDDLRGACEAAHRHGAWVHVDGAFGLWAAASPRLRHLVDGVELADSWGCDGHKWLNVPYDSAFAFGARPDVHAAAMSYTAVLPGRLGYGHGDFRLHRRVVPAGPRLRGLGRPARARPRRRRRPRRPVLRAGPPLRRPAARGRPRGGQRRACSTRCWSTSATASAPTR